MDKPQKGKSRYRCSFCGKAMHEVRRLIAGPQSVHICNECVLLCVEILQQEGFGSEPGGPSKPGKPKRPK